MRIRAFEHADLAQVVSCFTESVRVTASLDYDSRQIDVWAPIDPNLDAWHKRLAGGDSWVADVQGVVTGFVRIEPNGLIDLLYVHPLHARVGIGGELLRFACSTAAKHGARQLEANVSLTARPLFQKAGFRVEEERHFDYKGVAFCNFRMMRKIDVVPAA